MGIGIGGALAIGAGVSAAAGIGSALIGGSAAKSAASTQAGAANRAADLQLQQQQQVRGDLGPYNQVGQAANMRLASFALGLGDPTAENAALENTPGYNFALTQGLKSTQNSAAARGLGTSGAALKGAAGFVTGLAQNTYQANLLNPLQSLSQTGESAAAQTGTLGTTGAANAGAGLIGAGNASAAGTVGAANAAGNALSSIGNTAGQLPLNYLLYNKLLGGGAGGGGGGGGFYDNTSSLAA